MKTRLTSRSLSWAAALAAAALAAGPRAVGDEPPGGSPRPIRALLITGGCCHDYNAQKSIIPEGVSARARVEWTVVHEGGSSSNHRVSVYEVPGWADRFDVVVHNECFSAVTDQAFIAKALAPHRDGVAAVVIHCSMHTFRDFKGDDWREFLGVTSRRHGPQHPLEVKNLKPDHPVMKGFPSLWTTGKEELYNIDKVWPGAEPLAQAPENGKDHTCVWTNTYGKGRVFGTTLAHNNATMSDPVYLDLLTRGLLWSVNKLDDDGKPKPGYAVQK
jgi:type 1 glutamine amidotransferase